MARGYTQRRFAEEFGVSQSWLAKVELGQSRTGIQRICELFAAFELQLRVEVEPIGADNPLLALDNVILTPHVAGVTRNAALRVATMTAQNVVNALAGKALPPGHVVAQPAPGRA